MWSFKDHGKTHEVVFGREHPPGFRWLHVARLLGETSLMFLVHPSIPPEQMEGYAEVVGCRPAAGGTNPCPGAGCDWLSFQAHAKSIRKKPGFLRMISPIDAELFP